MKVNIKAKRAMLFLLFFTLGIVLSFINLEFSSWKFANILLSIAISFFAAAICIYGFPSIFIKKKTRR